MTVAPYLRDSKPQVHTPNIIITRGTEFFSDKCCLTPSNVPSWLMEAEIR